MIVDYSCGVKLITIRKGRGSLLHVVRENRDDSKKIKVQVTFKMEEGEIMTQGI